MENSVKIARWLRPWVFPKDVTTTAPADRFEVKHANAHNDKLTTVCETPIGNVDEEGLDALARETAETLEMEAEALEGVQKYVVVVLREGKPLGRLILRVRASDEENKIDDALSSEPPTTRGQLAQTQRHLESVMRINAAKDGAAWTAIDRILTRLSDENTHLREKHMETLILTEELLSNRSERDLAAKETAAKIEGRERMARNFHPLMGAIVKKLTGATPPDALPPEVSIFRGLAADLLQDEGKRAIMERLLTREQMIALLTLLEDEGERAEKEETQATNGRAD